MESKKVTGLYVLLAVILIAVVGTIVGGTLMFKKVDATNKAIIKMTTEEKEEEKEDDVVIAGQYTIKSTLDISDAYKSGDDSKLSEQDKETLEMASKILDEIIKDDMTDYDKELAIYEWMVTNVTTGSSSLMPASNDPESVSTPHGVLKDHNAVCVGYATTFRMLLQMVDIECKVVHNVEKYHSWDLVKLDDGWYHVDCYSDAGWNKYSNFNMSDSMCSRGHEWNREFWPAAIGTKYNYAIKNAVALNDVFEIPKKLRESLEKGGENLYFRIGKDPDGFKEKILSAMYSSAMEMTSAYCDVTFSMCEDDDKNKYLSILITKYGSPSQSTLSEENQTKLDEAMQEAFTDYAGEGMMDMPEVPVEPVG